MTNVRLPENRDDCTTNLFAQPLKQEEGVSTNRFSYLWCITI